MGVGGWGGGGGGQYPSRSLIYLSYNGLVWSGLYMYIYIYIYTYIYITLTTSIYIVTYTDGFVFYVIRLKSK